MARLDVNYLARLVEPAQRGDANAFAELFAATYPGQYSFALRFLGDERTAQESLQEIYVCALRELTKLRSGMMVLSWLNQISFRVCLRQQAERERYARSRRGEKTEFVSPEALTVRVGAQEFSIHQVLGLPFTEAQVLLLRYYCRMKPREIAALLGVRRFSVRRYADSALRRLRRAPGRTGGDAA